MLILQSAGLRGPQPLPRGGPLSFAKAHSRPPQAAARKYFINAHASANPRQKRFRTKGGRGDGALRIGDFLILENAKHPIQRRRKAYPEIVSPRRFFAPPFDVKRWLNRLRCQSSLTFGGMTTYIFIKQALRLRFFEPRSSPPPHAADCCRIPTAVGEQHKTSQ